MTPTPATARPALTEEQVEVLITLERDRLAKLVEGMIVSGSDGKKRPAGERMALAIAACAVRRGRHLTPLEQITNLARGLAEDGEHSFEWWFERLTARPPRATVPPAGDQP